MVGPDQEARADPAAGVAHRDAVRGVEQVGERDAVDGVHLGRVDDADRALLAPTSPSTGVTAKLLGGSHSSGSSANTSTPSGRSPVSSSASRRAASRGVSPGSIAPPGNDTCPGCERMSWARSVSSRSRCAPKSISTAPRRASESSGATKRVRSSAVIVRGSLGHGLQPVGDHPPTPRYFRAAAATSCLLVNTAASMWAIVPSASTKTVIGIAEMWGSGLARSSAPFGSATSG